MDPCISMNSATGENFSDIKIKSTRSININVVLKRNNMKLN